MKEGSLRVRRPFNARHLIMMPSIRPMQHKRRELPHQMVRRPPHLHMAIMRHSDELSIWREFYSIYRFLEIEVVEDCAAAEVGKEGAAVFVDGDEDVRVGAEGDGRDILSVLEWECV